MRPFIPLVFVLLSAFLRVLGADVDGPRFTITDLGELHPTGINDSGTIVGFYNRDTRQEGALWANGKITLLRNLDPKSGLSSDQDLFPYSVNSKDEITGKVVQGKLITSGFWFHDGKFDSLSTSSLKPGARGAGENYVPVVVNDEERLAGYAMTRLSDGTIGFRGFFTKHGWDGAKEFPLEKSGLRNPAVGINSSGEVIGNLTPLHGGQSRAIVSDTEKEPALNFLGSLGGNYSEATAINDKGEIVGAAALANGSVHAFLFDGNNWTDLGTLGGAKSNASALNADGEIVGYSEIKNGGSDSNVTHPFLYKSGKMYDLNQCIDPALQWTLIAATGINKSGQIIGNGTIGGSAHGFLLTPKP